MYTLDSEGFIRQRRLPDQRRISVQPWGFGGASLGISQKPPMHNVGVYADQWNYQRADDALKALQSWNPEESPEPTGWFRHVTTGRYRIDGDANLEYVKDADSRVMASIGAAIKVTQGADRVIIKIEQSEIRDDVLGLIDYTEWFRVISESSECHCDPRCQWIDLVYHRLDRCVIVAWNDLPKMSIGNVLRRLTE